jgi:hypothetical protein
LGVTLGFFITVAVCGKPWSANTIEHQVIFSNISYFLRCTGWNNDYVSYACFGWFEDANGYFALSTGD